MPICFTEGSGWGRGGLTFLWRGFVLVIESLRRFPGVGQSRMLSLATCGTKFQEVEVLVIFQQNEGSKFRFRNRRR